MKKQRLALTLSLSVALLQPLPILAQTVTESSNAAPSLLLAKELPAHVNVSDYLISEKYDGVRAFWDGRVLRFRGGGVVAAPVWFIQGLPKVPLDGELWLGRGQFEATTAIVRQQTPNDADWRRIRYMIFELPQLPISRIPNGIIKEKTFAERVNDIERIVAASKNPQLVAVPQFKLSNRQELQKKLDGIVQAGGEGLMLHLASAPYETGRSDVLYKLKPRQDAEAVVIAYQSGQGKYEGRLGALRVRTSDGREFNVGGGLSDAQRQTPPAIGTTITYQYNGLTKNGLPRFARFLRVRDGL